MWHHVILTHGNHIFNSQEKTNKKTNPKNPKPQRTHITVFNPALSISSGILLYHFRINNQGLSNVSSQIPAILLLNEYK